MARGRNSGGNAALRSFKAQLRTLPTTVAHDVARRAAPAVTSLSREALASGRTVYEEPRPLGVDGGQLSLKKTGAVERDMRFVSIGSIVRVVLGPKYAKYLIGKYGILPNGALPIAWARRIKQLVAETKVPRA